MDGPRWLARLPHVLVVVFAMLMVQNATYGSGQDPILVIAMLVKLGLRDRTQAAVYAYETGLVRPTGY